MLTIEQLTGNYGKGNVLHGLSLSVAAGQVVSVLGSNGAGKTSAMNAISGFLNVESGSIEFDGIDLLKKRPDQRSALGLAHVPEGRRVFKTLSVEDNLMLGAWSRPKGARSSLEEVYDLFPKLLARRKQFAGTLSGGEQQMLAIGRALMGGPKLLALDEPSMGLAPNLAEEVFLTLEKLKAKGLTMLIVEQLAKRALAFSDYAYVLQRGVVVLHGDASKFIGNDEVHKAYLS